MGASANLSGFGIGIILYLLTIPFSDVFAIHKWLPLYLVVLLPLIATYMAALLLSPQMAIIKLVPEDGLFLLFLTVLCFSTVIHTEWIDDYSLPHISSYFVTIACYYLFFRLIISAAKVRIASMITALAIGVVAVSIVGIYEFIVRNVSSDWGVLDLPGRASGREDYVAAYLGVFRSRSFMAESGLMALYLELIAPIVIFSLAERRKWGVAAVLSVLTMLGLFATVSVAALISLGFGLLVAILVFVYVKPERIKFVLAATLVFFLIGLWAAENQVVDGGAVSSVASKVTLKGGDASSRDRLERWSKALKQSYDSPLIGYGAGSFKAMKFEIEGGVVSFWLQVMFEGGAVALMALLSGYTLIFRRALLLPFSRKYGYIISLSAGFVHYAVISDYWKPWVWLVLAMVVYDSSLAINRSRDPR